MKAGRKANRRSQEPVASKSQKNDDSSLTPVQRALSNMTPALRAYCQKRILPLVSRIHSSELVNRHKLGMYIVDILSNKSKYGDYAAEQLAVVLNMSLSNISLHRSVATLWTEDQIKELSEREGEHGYRISWTHLSLIAQLPEDKQRDGVLARCFEKRLSTRETAALVESYISSGGRSRTKSIRPKSPTAIVSRLSGIADKIQELDEVLSSTVYEYLESAKDEDREKTIEVIRGIEEAIDIIRSFLDANAERISEIKSAKGIE